MFLLLTLQEITHVDKKMKSSVYFSNLHFNDSITETNK